MRHNVLHKFCHPGILIDRTKVLKIEKDELSFSLISGPVKAGSELKLKITKMNGFMTIGLATIAHNLNECVGVH